MRMTRKRSMSRKKIWTTVPTSGLGSRKYTWITSCAITSRRCDGPPLRCRVHNESCVWSACAQGFVREQNPSMVLTGSRLLTMCSGIARLNRSRTYVPMPELDTCKISFRTEALNCVVALLLPKVRDLTRLALIAFFRRLS